MSLSKAVICFCAGTESLEYSVPVSETECTEYSFLSSLAVGTEYYAPMPEADVFCVCARNSK